MDYWQRRNVRAQEAVSNKSIKEIEKQLSKYYRSTAERVMRDFEATYDKLLATTAAGRAPTPADLYKLDKYWQMQGQLKRELQRLGDQSVEALQKAFIKQFAGVYESLALPGGAHYTTASRETALQMINSIWCADGKAWSARVWANTDLLQETLNEQLVHCVVTGKKPTELKNLLQERFNVSYSQADTLVRTETAHIQTQAAQKRYEDYGIKEVEVWVDEDERTCPICAKHEGERYKVNDRMPVPFHPRCRCCMIPVIDVDTSARGGAWKAPKSNFTPAKTVAEATTYAEASGVKYAKLDKLTLETANNLNRALETLPADVRPVFVGDSKTLEQYWGGKLRRAPSKYYGVTVDVVDYIRIGGGEADLDTIGKMVGISSAYKTPAAITAAKAKAQADYMAKTGRKWFFNTNGEATAFHEMGHCYFDKRGAPPSFKWDAEKWAKESGCDMLKSESEAWAEAWAAYHTGNKELPDYIAKYIREAK